MKSVGNEFGLEVGIQTFPDLQHAMDVAVMGDSVLVCREGEQKVRGVGARGGGGRILCRAEGPKVVLSAGDTSLEEGRLELDMVEHGAGVLVRETVVKVVGKGKWQLKDCKVRVGGDGLDLGEKSEGN
jgi:hypothetical protein